MAAGVEKAAAAENRVWAYDFVFGACANGQHLKCLTVIDEYTGECVAIDVAGGIRSSRVIEPGKPWQNGSNESFNGKFRDECLSMEWFRNRIDTKIVIEAWRRHYSEVRPHSSLGNLTPCELKKRLSTQSLTEAIPQ